MSIMRSDYYWIEQLRRDGMEIVEVWNEPQVLLDDDYLIAESWNVEYEAATLEKHDGNPIITCEKPWEKVMSFTCGLYEEEDSTFKLWYGSYEKGNARTCYATSKDGINFEKPNLGLIEYEGSRDNNIVFVGPEATSVLKDFNEPDPEKRYKMGYDIVDHRGNGLSIATSPDGLSWTGHPYAVLNGHEFDSQNVIVWDDQRGHFNAYVRFWLYGQRQIRRATSPDLYHWSKLEWVHGLDEHDPINMDLYTPAVCKYSAAPNLFVMQTSVFEHTSNMLWIQLALSRDGIKWKRYRHPFVPRGEAGTWDSGSLYAVPSVMLHDDKLFIYYKAHDLGHVEVSEGGGIGVGTLRRDGFVALTAGWREGVVTTKTIAFSHDGPATPNKGRLTLNINASGGCARVELLDINGVPIPGFSKNECDPIESDSTLHVVTWQGKRAVDQLMGIPIKLRFYLTDCKLYSFRFLAYGTRSASLDDPEEQRLYDLDQINRNH